jgi:GT2 family glycosyltransferase
MLPDSCELHVAFGDIGSSRQRNRGLDWLSKRVDFLTNPGIIVFLDDDFIMRRDWLQNLRKHFCGCTSLIGLTGILLADGARGAGFSTKEALCIIEGGEPILSTDDWRTREGLAESLYGCNMAVRSAAMAELRFDEELPLYGWLEDYDLSSRLRKQGSLFRSPNLVGVHLGVKSGRSPGLQVGYSQVANPVYLHRKGTMSFRTAFKYAFKNVIPNVARFLSGDRYIDRKGRLKGNFLAILDLIRIRSYPGRILSLR